jgi:phospholipid/cholesterol/gamma-HCH transport system substrate-binding protein
VVKRKTKTTVVNGGTPTVEETAELDESAFKFSLQFTKRIGLLGARVGILESTGGGALDLHLFHDQLQLSTEFFDFNRKKTPPNIKPYALFHFFDYFYAIAGYSDALSKPKDEGRASFFAGIGLTFTDADLKTLAILPSSLP